MILDETLQQLVTHTVLFLPRLFVCLLIIAGFWLGSGLLQRAIVRVVRLGKMRQDVVKVLVRAGRLALLAFGTVTALGTLGIDVSALVAGLGLTGFALGFAFKDVLSNILSGILILSYRPFIPGDSISVAGYEGEVIGVDLRYTVLQAKDRTVLVPNSTLFTSVVVVMMPPSQEAREREMAETSAR